MPTCPNCGKENAERGGSFCSFCGAALDKGKINQPAAVTDSSQKSNEPQLLNDLGRLEKAAKRVELLTYVVGAEAIALIILLIFLYYTFYG
jgi:uncharacterized membrane protein YvbJ